MILLPFLISNVIVALVWFWLLDSQIGLVNGFIEAIGFDKIPFFGEPNVGDPDHRGGQRLAAHGIHRAADLRRAADDPRSRVRGGVDRRRHRVRSRSGGSRCRCCGRCWRWCWSITVVGSFQIFDTVAVTTKGGPGNASRVIQFYIYDQAFGQSNFGYASAISVILFLILIVVALCSSGCCAAATRTWPEEATHDGNRHRPPR